jgi:hypothetical protein
VRELLPAGKKVGVAFIERPRLRQWCPECEAATETDISAWGDEICARCRAGELRDDDDDFWEDDDDA